MTQSPYVLENRHIAIKHCRHGVFMYNRLDSFVGRGLDLYGEWCDFEIQLLRQFMKPGDTVVDVGANIGTHTVAFANAVGPTGTVHAYEPQRRLFAMLAGNVALNALECVVCHQQAVGATAGEIHLAPLPPADTYFNNSSVKLSQDNRIGEKIPLVTLDALELNSCAVVKIDVEGMENLVLEGAANLIESHRPIIYVEDNGPAKTDVVAEMMIQKKYQPYWSAHPHYNPENFYCNPFNTWEKAVWSANLFCVPQEREVDYIPQAKFLGPGDSWFAYLQRMQAQQ